MAEKAIVEVFFNLTRVKIHPPKMKPVKLIISSRDSGCMIYLNKILKMTRDLMYGQNYSNDCIEEYHTLLSRVYKPNKSVLRPRKMRFVAAGSSSHKPTLLQLSTGISEIFELNPGFN